MYKPNGVASVLTGASYLPRTAAFAVVLLAAMAFFLFAGTKEARAQEIIDVDVNPDAEDAVQVDVGDVEVGEDAVREIRLINTGDEAVEIGGFDLEGLLAADEVLGGVRLIDDDLGILDLDDLLDGTLLDLGGLLGGEELVIEPGEEAILELTVSPDTDLDVAGDLEEISLGDLDLDLLGEGLLGDTLNTINIIGNATPEGDDEPEAAITNPKKKIKDRTPTVRADFSDDGPDIQKEDIDLFIDGSPVPQDSFAYDQGTESISYTTDKLSRKKHTVRVTVEDSEGQDTTAQKDFKVKKKRR